MSSEVVQPHLPGIKPQATISADHDAYNKSIEDDVERFNQIPRIGLLESVLDINDFDLLAVEGLEFLDIDEGIQALVAVHNELDGYERVLIARLNKDGDKPFEFSPKQGLIFETTYEGQTIKSIKISLVDLTKFDNSDEDNDWIMFFMNDYTLNEETLKNITVESNVTQEIAEHYLRSWFGSDFV